MGQKIKVKKCSSCGQDHVGLPVLDNLLNKEINDDYRYYFICPITKEQVFIKEIK